MFSKALPILAFFGGMAVLRADTPATTPTLSVAEMSARAESLQTQIRDDHRKLLALKSQANKLKDIIKLNCVNDKLVQVKAEMDIADNADEQLQTALAQEGQDRQSLFNQLADAANEVKRLRSEASSCLGEPELYKQEAGATVEHPEIPDDPNAQDPFYDEVEPPAYASPYR